LSQILIVGIDNAVRSQMLEGYLKKKLGHQTRVYSCGIEPSGVDPQAIRAMAEDQVVIAGQTSDALSEFSKFDFDQIFIFDETVQRDLEKVFPHVEPVLLAVKPIEGFGGLERLEQIRVLRSSMSSICDDVILKHLS